MAVAKVARRPIEGLGAPVDAAVSHHLGAGEHLSDDPLYGEAAKRARARNQTPAQRKKAARDRQRNKVTLDLPERMTTFINQVADEYQVPPSHVAALLLEFAMEHWDRIDIESRKVRSRNLRFEWFLDVA